MSVLILKEIKTLCCFLPNKLNFCKLKTDKIDSLRIYMKYLLCFILIFLMGCKSYDLDGDRERNPRIKKDKGDDTVTEFDFPEIENLDLDEIRKNKKTCSNYDNHTVQHPLLGSVAILNFAVNCIAYGIDKGLEPICEAEARAKEELDRSNDDDYTEALENYLENLENQKDDFIDDISEIADEFYDLCRDFEDEGKDEVNDTVSEGWARKGLNILFRTVAIKDCERTYKVMDSKVELACSGINFEALHKKETEKK